MFSSFTLIEPEATPCMNLKISVKTVKGGKKGK